MLARKPAQHARLRACRDDPEGPAPSYPRGSIMRVKVHDFMTYTGTVVITPGPRLNLVLGPNGACTGSRFLGLVRRPDTVPRFCSGNL